MTDDASTGSATGGGRPEGVRLQKVLANAGVASRRVSEDLIVQGRVRVNGVVVTELGNRIDPETDIVDVDGTAIQLDTSKRYVMLNKPTGVVSSMKDDRGRRDLRDFTRDWDERLYNVGRLDADTSGLLILTNDGELAHVLAHPVVRGHQGLHRQGRGPGHRADDRAADAWGRAGGRTDRGRQGAA